MVKYFCNKRVFEPATSCVRNQDATTVPARHVRDKILNLKIQFMLQRFLSFSEFAEFTQFPFHLGKNSIEVAGGKYFELAVASWIMLFTSTSVKLYCLRCFM